MVLGEARGPDGGALLRSPKSHWSTRGVAVKQNKGSMRAESRRRHGIARIRAHLRRRCRVEFGRMQMLGSGKVGLGGFQTPRWCSGVICDGCGALARRVHGGAEALHRR